MIIPQLLSIQSVLLVSYISERQAGGEDEPADKLRPCKFKGSSEMTTESLREKIVLLGIKAMEKFDGYYDRASYISDELDREEKGYWG